MNNSQTHTPHTLWNPMCHCTDRVCLKISLMVSPYCPCSRNSLFSKMCTQYCNTGVGKFNILRGKCIFTTSTMSSDTHTQPRMAIQGLQLTNEASMYQAWVGRGEYPKQGQAIGKFLRLRGNNEMCNCGINQARQDHISRVPSSYTQHPSSHALTMSHMLNGVESVPKVPTKFQKRSQN